LAASVAAPIAGVAAATAGAVAGGFKLLVKTLFAPVWPYSIVIRELSIWVIIAIMLAGL
jgi:hypothetical protein